jgi:hypothetical protein
MMAKKDSVEVVDSVDAVDEEVIAEATKTTGRTPHDVKVVIRETAKMLEAVKMSTIGEVYIGTFFVPYEGQPGIEGLVNAAAGLINNIIRQGWQPWQMATPYGGQYSFNLNGVQTGVLNGQWLTIIFGKPVEDLQ